MPLGIYTSTAFRNASGVQVVPNANVEVRRESDGSLAVIYSTRDADSNTEIDQVGYPGTAGFKADVNGYFEFYAEGRADGYQVRVYSDDLTLDKTLRYQPTGTARERDASDHGGALMGAEDEAASRAILNVYSEAEVDAAIAAAIAAATPPSADDDTEGLIEIATQAEQEAGTDATKAVTPGRQRFHPSAAKAWGQVDRSAGTPTLQSPSYNITSVTDDGVGNTIVTFDTDFSDDDYAPGATTFGSSSGIWPILHSIAVGSVDVAVVDHTGAAHDTTSFSVWAFGDQ